MAAPKPSITTDDVRRAVKQIKSAGRKVSNRAIRDIIGGRHERVAELLAQIEVEDEARNTPQTNQDGTHSIDHPQFREWLDANLAALAHNSQPWLEAKLPYKGVPDGINLLGLAAYFEQRERVAELEGVIETLEARAPKTGAPFLRTLPLPYDGETGGSPRSINLWFGTPWDDRGDRIAENGEDFDEFEGATLNLALAMPLLRTLSAIDTADQDALRTAATSLPAWVREARTTLCDPVRPASTDGQAIVDLDTYFEAETYYRKHRPAVTWWEGLRRGTPRQQSAHLERHASNVLEMSALLRSDPAFFKLVVALCRDAGVPWCVDDSPLAEDVLKS